MSDNKDLVVIDGDNLIDDAALSRVDRSGIIEPGHYWYCRKEVAGLSERMEGRDFDFVENGLYLLTRLEFFDGKLHSVVLLDDPSQGTDRGILTLPLLLEHFEQMSDEAAKEHRQRQMQAIQSAVADVQAEMAEAIANPALLESVVAEGIQRWEREQAWKNRKGDEDEDDDKPAPQAQLPALTASGQFSLAGAVRHRIRSTDIDVFRHMAQRQGKIAEIQANWMKEKGEDIGRILKRLAPFYSEGAALGLARAHEQLGLAKEVEKGLRSLRLYTGETVEVVQLAAGDSAPAGEPLTLYQRKLYMDEEFAVWDRIDRMFDYGDTDLFFTALRENEALRKQLIPAPRGVVGMAVRRTDVKYDAKSLEEMLANAARNERNKALFLLVRDGDNWYQVFSGEPSHEVSPRLFPTRDEMDDIFTGFDGEKIGFEDLRFTNRTKEFDRKSLAYKRFLILACGLDHREKLFGQFYPERDALNFISMEFQRKYMRFVADDDSDVMLGDNIPSVHALIADNHSQLAAGCRVLVFCEALLYDRDAAPGAYSKGSYVRGSGTHYSLLVRPTQKAMFLTVRRDKDDLVVNLPVKRKSEWVHHGWSEATRAVRMNFSVKVALNKLKTDALAYLVTDTLRAEELRPYIYSRAQRVHHWNYIYGFKLAVELMGAEEAQNAPMLAHLEQEARIKFGLTTKAAAIAATTAAQSWRLKNPEFDVLPSAGAPAYAELEFHLAEAAYAFTHAVPMVQKHIEHLGGKAVRIMRGKKGQLIAYYEQPDAEKDLRVSLWNWVGRRTFSAAGRPTKDEPQTLWLAKGRIIGETELYSAPSELVHDYAGNPDQLKRLSERLNKVDEMAAILADAFKGEREGVSDRAWLMLTAARDKEAEKLDRDQTVILPIALDTAACHLVGVRVKVWELLHHYGSDAQRQVLLAQGYKPPKPTRTVNGEPVPYEGVGFYMCVDQYFSAERYTGPIGTDVFISISSDFDLGPWDHKEANRLDFTLNFVLTHNPEDKPKKRRDSFDRSVYLNGRHMYVPAAMRKEDGSAGLSRLFPGLANA